VIPTKSIAKGVGLVAGAVGAVAGAAWAAERIENARVRRRPDPDAHHDLHIKYDESVTIPSHDEGTIHIAVRFPRSPSQATALASMGGEAAIAAGDKNAPTIVFLHGVTINSNTWVKQFEDLPELGFRTIAVDSRGHGESKCGTSGYSVANLARDLYDALEALDVHDVVVVGQSMGGVATQAYAIEYPDALHERVRGIVLLSSLSRAGFTQVGWMRSVILGLSQRTPPLGAMMGRRDLGFALARIGFGREPLASNVELTRQMLAECPTDTWRGALAALVGFDLTPGLPYIDVPTLVIQGTADVLTPPADSRRIAKLIPGARLAMVRGAGHMIMLEEPEQFEHLLIEFSHEVGIAPAPLTAAKAAALPTAEAGAGACGGVQTNSVVAN
jgi:3-oxoadipate enol-lactonase